MLAYLSLIESFCQTSYNKATQPPWSFVIEFLNPILMGRVASIDGTGPCRSRVHDVHRVRDVRGHHVSCGHEHVQQP